MPVKKARSKTVPRRSTAAASSVKKKAARVVAKTVKPRKQRVVTAPDLGVYLNIPGRAAPFLLTIPPEEREVRRLALKWSYSLRNRERWAWRSDLLEKHSEEIHAVATLCGVDEVILKEIAAVDVVEISIPFTTEDDRWELRIMPWEYVLATAVRDLRDKKADGLTVVRRLRAPGSPP